MTKTNSTTKCRRCFLFGSFEFPSFDIVSGFEFRASDFKNFSIHKAEPMISGLPQEGPVLVDRINLGDFNNG